VGRGIVQLGLVVLVSAVAACGGGGEGESASTTQPGGAPTTAASTTTGPVATADQLKTVLLTPQEVGSGFQGDPPVIDERRDVVAARPLCDIPAPQPRVRVSVGPIINTPDVTEQVFERITIEEDAGLLFEVHRRRGEARCAFQETASGGITYTVKVDGPVDVGQVGDEALGFAQTFSQGYDGHRWDMLARQGRLAVNVQYTSTKPIDPARARALFAAAVTKAAPLR
jgi:hypothetical protein